jgi:hypothetical protein
MPLKLVCSKCGKRDGYPFRVCFCPIEHKFFCSACHNTAIHSNDALDAGIIGRSAVNLTTSTWSETWPTETGRYWFYGWCFENHTDSPALYYVNVRKCSNGVMRYTDGHFIYKSDGAIGLWSLVQLPDLPSIGVINK